MLRWKRDDGKGEGDAERAVSSITGRGPDGASGDREVKLESGETLEAELASFGEVRCWREQSALPASQSCEGWKVSIRLGSTSDTGDPENVGGTKGT